MSLEDLGGPADLIEWQEGDIRDAMEAFDPGAKDLDFGKGVVGVRGRRNGITVAAYWPPVPMGLVYPHRPRGIGAQGFFDPIEAIAEGLRLVGEQAQ